MVAAASSVLTQLIDPNDKRMESFPLFEPGFLTGGVTTQSLLTNYTRFCWLIGPIFSGVAVLMTIAAAVIQRRD